ncbi:hypothetical protein ACFOYU_19150 [Microvirga sp. GCM10011540]|uniref:hypothetical protein n=1 Tax=Microvirga sp. GCM10011540 TaxID=3317338 RepID=UPI003611B25C
MRLLPILLTILLTCAADAVHAQNIDDHLRTCEGGNDFCESSQQQFKKWFSNAYKKDCQGQRNVSFCLTDCYKRSVQVNRPLGCAWRLVILASGSPKVDSTDTGFFDSRCRKLSGSEALQMKSQADALFREIYKRPLPDVL